MKTQLVLLTLLLSPWARAGMTYVFGQGNSFEYCNGNMFDFCKQNVERRAEADAIRDATFSCQAQQGQIHEYTALCNGTCTPFAPPAPNEGAFVNCQSRCQVECETPN